MVNKRILPLPPFQPLPQVVMIAVLVLFIGAVRAEWLYDEVSWSSSICSDHGINENLFDLCAILEFCEGDGVTSATNYPPPPPPLPYGYSPSTSEPSSIMGQTITQQSRGAKFGWRIDGATTCTSPGPILRLNTKERYALLVKGGSSSTVTNLHTHGLHIAGTGNADDVTRTVAPGDTLLYNLTLTKNHMGGTFWYHSHHHPHTKEHVSGGAFGMLIVDEDDENIGTTDPQVLSFLKKERILIVDNIQGNNIFIANGQPNGDTYEFQKDEWYRLRILLVSVDDYQSGATLSFGDDGACTVYPIAYDGILTFTVPSTTQPKSTYYMSTSSRLDVAIQCHSSASIKVQYSTIATITVSSDNTTTSSSSAATPFEKGLNPWSSNRPPYLADLRDLPVDDTLDITMYETTINQMPFSLETPLCNSNGQDFKYNSVIEWTLLSTTSHPFHSHVYPMQVISGCGEGHEVGEFYDTITLKNKMNSYYDSGDTSSCIVRVRLVDFAGHVMMHCHILLHSEQGSMAFFNVVDGPSQPVEPRALSCGNNNNKECDTVVQPKHCSGPQYPMSHSADMNIMIINEDMNMDMNINTNQMMDTMGDEMKKQTKDTTQYPNEPMDSSSNPTAEMMSINSDEQVNSDVEVVQELDQLNSQNSTPEGSMDYNSTEYTAVEEPTISSSPTIKETNNSKEQISAEATEAEQIDEQISPGSKMGDNTTTASTEVPLALAEEPSASTSETEFTNNEEKANAEVIGSNVMKQANESLNSITSAEETPVKEPSQPSGAASDLTSINNEPKNSDSSGMTELDSIVGVLADNSTSISSNEGATVEELSLIEAMNMSSEKTNSEGTPVQGSIAQGSAETLSAINEKQAATQASESGAVDEIESKLDSVNISDITLDQGQLSGKETGSMPTEPAVDENLPVDSHPTNATSPYSTNSISDKVAAAPSNEKINTSFVALTLLACMLLAFIVTFFIVRRWTRWNTKRNYAVAGRNEEEEIGLNRVV